MALTSWGRRNEILREAQQYLDECCSQMGLPPMHFSSEAREWIGRRSWEGKAAELKRYVYLAALISPGEEVAAAHFPPLVHQDHVAYCKKQFESLALEALVSQKIAHFFARLGDHEVMGVADAVMAQVQRPLIENALAWARGNQLKAARALGINRNTLRKRMREMGIE